MLVRKGAQLRIEKTSPSPQDVSVLIMQRQLSTLAGRVNKAVNLNRPPLSEEDAFSYPQKAKSSMKKKKKSNLDVLVFQAC